VDAAFYFIQYEILSPPLSSVHTRQLARRDYQLVNIKFRVAKHSVGLYGKRCVLSKATIIFASDKVLQ